MNSHSTNRPLSKGENLTVWGTLSIATFATLAAITLGCLGAALDDHDAAKQPVTTAAPDAASEAREQAQVSARRELSAAALCRHQHGAGTRYTWTAADQLVCLPESALKQAPAQASTAQAAIN